MCGTELSSEAVEEQAHLHMSTEKATVVYDARVINPAQIAEVWNLPRA